MPTLSKGLEEYKKQLHQEPVSSKSAELLQKTVALKQNREAMEAQADPNSDVSVIRSLVEEGAITQRLNTIQTLLGLGIALNLLFTAFVGWILLENFFS